MTALPRQRPAPGQTGVPRWFGHPLLRVVTVAVVTLGLGWWASPEVTRWEAAATGFLAHLSGLDMTRQLPGTDLVRGYYGYQPFFIRVTPSCSALTTSVAATGVSVFVLGGTWWQRILGSVCGVVLLTAGNLVRLVAVLWVGRGAGIPTMITFHDWGGTVFSYLLLLTALLLLIAVRLPSRRKATVRREETAARGEEAAARQRQDQAPEKDDTARRRPGDERP